MIHRSKAIALSLTLVGLIAAPVQAYQNPSADSSDAVNVTKPVPTRVVQPGVAPEQVGQAVTLRFTVDENGKPHNIQAAQPRTNDPVLVARMIRAVRSWEFEPARGADGQPIEMTVEMPIVVNKLSHS
ncbi:MAG: TonB family protein [Opitutaceae bacterium]